MEFNKQKNHNAHHECERFNLNERLKSDWLDLLSRKDIVKEMKFVLSMSLFSL